jgi:hypothetical protein
MMIILGFNPDFLEEKELKLEVKKIEDFLKKLA